MDKKREAMYREVIVCADGLASALDELLKFEGTRFSNTTRALLEFSKGGADATNEFVRGLYAEQTSQ